MTQSRSEELLSAHASTEPEFNAMPQNKKSKDGIDSLRSDSDYTRKGLGKSKKGCKLTQIATRAQELRPSKDVCSVRAYNCY